MMIIKKIISCWLTGAEKQSEEMKLLYDRRLEDTIDDTTPDNVEDNEEDTKTWETIYTSVVLVIMFALLISDKYGSDSIMLLTLAAFLCSEIITVTEGVEGFANEGLLTILLLCIVAEGVSKTGALDWYLGKLLGRPKTVASAQIRMMIPIVVVSTFLNNTPIVLIMIPVLQRWSKKCGIPVNKLLIPLSYATILGGTCSIIGTSTNLVVMGLLHKHYPNDAAINNISLFDIGIYGVPNAVVGLAYILFFSPYLLCNNKDRCDAILADGSGDDTLLGAVVTKFSPAAGRTVDKTGLRDAGGIYLVSVKRATTGHVHHAVSSDFVVNVGDVLYFTGLVEEFGTFCDEHGLDILTVETEPEESKIVDLNDNTDQIMTESSAYDEDHSENKKVNSLYPDVTREVIGCNLDSLLKATDSERLQIINQVSDLIQQDERGGGDSSSDNTFSALIVQKQHDPPQIIINMDYQGLVVVFVGTRDRVKVLPDIAECLQSSLDKSLEIRHTEATAIGQRSLSIWRCEIKHKKDVSEIEDNDGVICKIWTELHSVLSNSKHMCREVSKEGGLRVIRASIIKGSRLIGKTPKEVDLRANYKAAIVSMKDSKEVDMDQRSRMLRKTMSVGDILILQASNDSPLLERPPKDFYNYLNESKLKLSLNNSKNSLNHDSCHNNELNSFNHDSLHNNGFSDMIGLEESNNEDFKDNAWKDLRVIFQNNESEDNGAPSFRKSVCEFLTAMVVAPKSRLRDKTVAQAGIDKLPDLFLVSIERKVEKKSDTSFLTKSLRNLSIRGSNQSQGLRERKPRESLTKRTRSLVRESFYGNAEDYFNDPNAEASKSFSIKSPRESLTQQQRSTLRESFHGNPREFFKEMNSARTRKPEMFFQAVSPDEPLQVGDVLWYSGPANAIGDLRKIPGLTSYQSEEVNKLKDKVHDRRLVQAVIAKQGPLIGKTVKEVNFGTRYGAAVIAVHRDGKRVHEHPGNVKLQAGDVLLLEAGPSFIAKSDSSFALLAEVKDSAPPRMKLLIPALLLLVGMLAVYMANLADLFVSAMVCSILMVCFGILSEQEARDAVNWKIYITIASAFAVGTAMQNSGVASAIAGCIVDIGDAINIGQTGYLGVVYLATVLLSNILQNSAAVALLFPVAMEAAEASGTDLVLMSFSLMLATSSSFMTPTGYQTNLFVYGPGGYTYMDYVKFGGPMQIYLWIFTTLFLSSVISTVTSWTIAFSLLALVVLLSVVDIFGKIRGLRNNTQRAERNSMSKQLKQNENNHLCSQV